MRNLSELVIVRLHEGGGRDRRLIQVLVNVLDRAVTTE
jgi:hypothetical protein